MSLKYRLNKRKKAIETIDEISRNPSHILIIHYSCESLYDINEGKTPRITSIAVRYFNTAQTKSFAIHRIAETKRIAFNEIETHYDALEKDMLKDFFQFVKKHKDFSWVHWNMRDLNFGFEAIENRFTVLGGKPEVIDSKIKIDLPRFLVDIYGLNYIGHPRLERLTDRNNISRRDFLSGEVEAKAFDNKEYVKLHQSTLKKVDIFHTVLEKVDQGSLKTNSRFYQVYGLTPQGIFESVKDHWLYAIVNLIIGAIIGAIISKI
ncbi:hypothetical protein [Paenibacillus macquariensis]|uniref:Exonuclease n=1 Tax=Paenibacillus macquariensis TaxID=948756 RepID=A0ABY1JK58_9BACL|nr:hypothetical protein [Paenibacillus macquariensis]MEC0089867.1 hypothetical protein [Paenibacillus macquariensis]OAB30670.1 hypothetical protein PMSM_21225 [Paenibacillus macquariensis subsp. macquariensis]SIQ32981.1 hypothetical protein SAMN05421578_101247 [Paenibacillus macquariensis]